MILLWFLGVGGVAFFAGYMFCWLDTRQDTIKLTNALYDSRTLVIDMEQDRTEMRRRFGETALKLNDTEEALRSAHAALRVLRKGRSYS